VAGKKRSQKETFLPFGKLGTNNKKLAKVLQNGGPSKLNAIRQLCLERGGWKNNRKKEKVSERGGATVLYGFGRKKGVGPSNGGVSEGQTINGKKRKAKKKAGAWEKALGEQATTV